MHSKHYLRCLDGLLRGRPLYVNFRITHRCNLHCKMCEVIKEPQPELSLRDIENLANVLKKMGIVYVSLGGGEPLVRDDIFSVIEMLTGKGFIVRLLTNGTLISDTIIEKLAHVGVNELSISLHSLSPERHQFLYGDAETGQKILNNLSRIQEALQSQRSVVLLNTVVSKLNLDEIPALCHYAAKNKYFISLSPVESNEKELVLHQQDNTLIDAVYERIIAMKKSGKSAIFNSMLFLEQSREYLKGKRRLWHCDAGTRYFSINPEGKASLCHRFLPEGSLLEKDFLEYLKSTAFERKRNKSIAECEGCMFPCWAEISNVLRNKRSMIDMIRHTFIS